MKAFRVRDVYDIQSWEKSKKYLGDDGYFGNDLTQLTRAIKYSHIGILANFYRKKSLCNVFATKGGRNYGLFLPKEAVYEVVDSRIKRKGELFV